MGRIDFKQSTLMKFGGTIFDVVLVNLGYYVAFMLRYNFNPSDRNLYSYINIIPYISIIAFVLFTIYGTTLTFKRDFEERFFSIAISLVLINLSTVAAAFLLRSFAFPRSVVLIAFFIQFFLLVLWDNVLSKLKVLFAKEKNVILFANPKDAKIISQKIFNAQSTPYKVKNIFDILDDNAYKAIDEVDEVFIHSNIDEELKTKIISYCYDIGKAIYLIPTLYDIYIINSKFEKVDDIPLFRIQNSCFSIEQRIIKRFLDITLSVLILIITLPISLITCLAIKVCDKGPVMFSQERVTINNKLFTLYKFRTMNVNAEEVTGPVLSDEIDDRVTSVGKFLRATRVDELPQFINVLRGDMSIVGPRPERECFIKEYAVKVPEFKYRTSVKAGITGLAQVMGKYSTKPSDKVKFDLLYIKRASILLDLRLILLTVKVMFMKLGFSGLTSGNKQKVYPKINVNK